MMLVQLIIIIGCACKYLLDTIKERRPPSNDVFSPLVTLFLSSFSTSKILTLGLALDMIGDYYINSNFWEGIMGFSFGHVLKTLAICDHYKIPPVIFAPLITILLLMASYTTMI